MAKIKFSDWEVVEPADGVFRPADFANRTITLTDCQNAIFDCPPILAVRYSLVM